MSISLEEARRKLDILEKLSDKPELILTDLFSYDISGLNFLYQVSINDKYIMDYFKEHLSSIHPFKDCLIENSHYEFSFYLPSLKVGKYSKFAKDDLIAKINLNNKTYRIFTECINSYEDVMNKEYKFEESKLSDWWQKFTDLSIKNRLHQINEIIHSEQKFLRKISNVYFWLVMTKTKRRKIQETLNRKNEEIANSNEHDKERYKENIERQLYYKEYAPEQIEKIKRKQREIAKYLKQIGYVEDAEMSRY